MKQYCRYCAFCIEGDCYICTLHEKELNEDKIKRSNKCSDFDLSVMGDIITGKQYKPREPRKPDDVRNLQLKFE